MRTLFSLLFLLSVSGIAAQEKRRKPAKVDPAFIRANKFALTFSPLALVQLDFTLMSGAEYRLSNRIRLVTDAGYIFGSTISSTDNRSNGTGFIVRPGLKIFISEKGSFYVQPQGFYKQVNQVENGWVDKNVVNGVAAYQQLQDYTFRRTVYGANVVAGLMEPIGRNSKKFVVDTYIGFGVRWRKSAIAGEPKSRPATRLRDAWNSQDGVFPSLPIGVRLLYLF